MIKPGSISATCTWCVRSASGFYVQEPVPGTAMTSDIGGAYLWMSEASATKFVDKFYVPGQPKMLVVRARP